MSISIRERLLAHLKSADYRPVKRRKIARTLELDDDSNYAMFKEVLNDLEDEGVVAEGDGGTVVLATTTLEKNEVIALYSGNKKGFGFLDVREPIGHPQLFVPGEYNNAGAVTGDVVKAKRMDRPGKQPGDLDLGRVTAIVKRAHSRLVGSLQHKDGRWFVMPDGNLFPKEIETPDAAGKYIKAGTKVVVEITKYPTEFDYGQGVVSEVLGQSGEKDVDLKSIIVQSNLPEDFPEEVKAYARKVVDAFDPEAERARRLDMTGEMVLTIDPDDAKDYDDAISMHRTDDGHWELGVHIADVSHFVKPGTPLDAEAQHRGNSTYFPGHVIPMLPEILSNGVCSLQEGVPRLVKSAFITIDQKTGRPLRTRFANSIIQSHIRLRYREAQALIDGADVIPHPEGDRKPGDYDAATHQMLADMNHVSRLIHVRRQAAGQLRLDLPKVELKLDETGKVVDAVPEDDAFTHTLIEMFMVEANEAVARLFQRLDVPAIRRIHPDPDPDASARLNRFVMVAGYKIPTEPTRQDLQKLLASVRGKPEAFAVNLAVLKSVAKAEYSPQEIGHYALASQHYTHFTSPIRRYADLTIHRLLDSWFDAINARFDRGPLPFKAAKLKDIPSYDDLVMAGQHLSFTERRSEGAERELRQVKLLTLMEQHVGEQFLGVVTAITKFGLFIQLDKWLVEGLIRYPQLMNEYWEVDEKGGVVRGRNTGQRIHIGDVAEVEIARVDVPRRELDLHVLRMRSRGEKGAPLTKGKGKKRDEQGEKRVSAAMHDKQNARSGGERRSAKSKARDKGKESPRRERKKK